MGLPTFCLFVKGILRHWVALMTGVSSLALAILMNLSELFAASNVFWAVAGISCVIAMYLAWLDEHKKGRSEEKFQQVLNEWIMSGNEVIKRIKDDPGVAGTPGQLKQPSPEVQVAAEKWVREAREMIKREHHDFLGRFDSVDDFIALVWVLGDRGQQFNDLIETVAARIKRLIEFQAQAKMP